MCPAIPNPSVNGTSAIKFVLTSVYINGIKLSSIKLKYKFIGNPASFLLTFIPILVFIFCVVRVGSLAFFQKTSYFLQCYHYYVRIVNTMTQYFFQKNDNMEEKAYA